MKSPRVAYISADPGVSVFGRKGCSIHAQEVIRALRGQGARVELFAARLGGTPPPGLQDLPVHALPCPSGGDLAARERACQRANAHLHQRLQNAGSFDLLYERYSLWSFAGLSFARAAGAPALLEVNAPLIEEQAAHRGLVDRAGAERIAARAFREARALIAVSDEVAAWLRGKVTDPAVVCVIPNGVNPARFPRDASPAWHWPGHATAFTVGFVGTLKPWHGLPLLLDAFARLYAQAPDARLLIVGDGPERGALQTLIARLHLQSVVHFTGAVAAEEIPGLLAAMDVAVAPYPRMERFYFSPLKVFEYMAAGRAVIASRVGQLATLIHHHKNGLLCQPGDAAELAAHLALLRADVSLRTRLGEAARQTIVRHHTWDQVAQRILSLARPPRRVFASTSLAPCALAS